METRARPPPLLGPPVSSPSSSLHAAHPIPTSLQPSAINPALIRPFVPRQLRPPAQPQPHGSLLRPAGHQLPLPFSLPLPLHPHPGPAQTSQAQGHAPLQPPPPPLPEKEKTPMCRIAELARHHKLVHEYKLRNEAGPAHQKTFTVDLVLCPGEVHEGNGASIKKAQQDAAAKALLDTKLAKPFERRQTRPQRPVQPSPTPTVLLNAIAHRLGAIPVYKTLDDSVLPHPSPHLPPQLPGPSFLSASYPPPLIPSPAQHHPPAGFQPHPHLPHFSTPLQPIQGGPMVGGGRQREALVNLRVAGLNLFARGPTKQDARHNVATQALAILQPSSLYYQPSSAPSFSSSAAESSGLETSEESLASLLAAKSPISLLHEVALQKRTSVVFEVLAEEGPAHDRSFVVRCALVGLGAPPSAPPVAAAEGRGKSKKAGKQAACEGMLELLASQGPLPAPVLPRRPRQPKELKRKTIVKDAKMDPDYGCAVNPVSRLIQIQQVKGAPEPRFVFLSETGQSRAKEFLMEVRVEDDACQGSGQNKKLAKRAAAEAMLARLGYAKEMPKPGRSVLKKASIDELDTPSPPPTTSGPPGPSDSEAPVLNGASPPATPPPESPAASPDPAEDAPPSPVAEQPSSASPPNGTHPDPEDAEKSPTPEEAHTTSQPSEPKSNGPVSQAATNGPMGNGPSVSLVGSTSAAGRKVRFRLEANRRAEFLSEQSTGLWVPPHGHHQSFPLHPLNPAAGALPGGGGGGKRVPRRAAVGQTLEMGRMAREMLAVLDSQARISRHSSTPSTAAIQQLSYLASILSFHIHFTDFPRTVTSEGRAEHLSLVSLGVAPPRVCHGSGSSLEEARNEAAVGALRALAENLPLSPACPAPASPDTAQDLHWPGNKPAALPHPQPHSRRSAKIAAANSQLKAAPHPASPNVSPTPSAASALPPTNAKNNNSSALPLDSAPPAQASS